MECIIIKTYNKITKKILIHFKIDPSKIKIKIKIIYKQTKVKSKKYL